MFHIYYKVSFENTKKNVFLFFSSLKRPKKSFIEIATYMTKSDYRLDNLRIHYKIIQGN